MMQNEEAWIAPYYAGDFLTMHDENPDLAFCFPKEGFNKFVDAICIPKGAANKKEAEMYINFLCDPEISGKNMDAIGYSTPISAAKEYISEEYANSPVAYPSEEVLERGEIFTNLPENTLHLLDSLWSGVKIENRGWILYVAIGAVVVVLVVIAVVLRARRRKQSNLDED